MRKFVFLIGVLLVQISLYAQEYYPEGTKWTEIRYDTLKYDGWYSKVGDEWVPNFETVEYYVKDEYIDKYYRNNPFKCVYTNGPEWTDSLTLLIYEKENFVYATVAKYIEDGVLELLPGIAYNFFDWSIGDTLYYRDIISANITQIPPVIKKYGTITKINERSCGGNNVQKCAVLNTGLYTIHGIGVTEWNNEECLFGPVNSYLTENHYRSMLVHFERNGEVLYDVWPDKVSSLNIVLSTKPKQENTIYDLSGRKIANGQEPRAKGLYIVNGKKVAVK